MLSSRIAALLISLGFLAVGIGAWLSLVPDSTTALPHALFYLILIANTYFSIAFFSRIDAATVPQRVLDVVLGANYLLLAASIGRPALFESIGSSLFALATIKYMLLVRIVNLKVVRRKIRIDLFGCGLCAAALAGSLIGYRLESAWAMTVVFAIANVYLLILRPMYQPDDRR